MQTNQNDLLRFATIGSVDDGKSTLIGRLLFDTKSLMEDQIFAVEELSKKRGENFFNFALLTDGLKAEREQGITIDVAYRYATTPGRKFIIADCPGHVQYTRNMVTGISTCNLVIVLVDARKGLQEQTKRHSFISSLLGIKHLVLCVNKMDLVNYEEKIFNDIKNEFVSFMSKLEVPDLRCIPISALNGDNVVEKSNHMPWYKGSSLLDLLENVYVASDYNYIDARFPVQRIIRPQMKNFEDYRAYAGRVEGGSFKPGDQIMVLPSGFTSKIKSIENNCQEINEAFFPLNINMCLVDEIDIDRGDMIVKVNNVPKSTQDLDLILCWLNPEAFDSKRKFIIKHTTREVRGVIKEVLYKININTLHRETEDLGFKMNEIGRVKIRTTAPLFLDDYHRNKNTGSLLIIDEFTNETVAAGMIKLTN